MYSMVSIDVKYKLRMLNCERNSSEGTFSYGQEEKTCRTVDQATSPIEIAGTTLICQKCSEEIIPLFETIPEVSTLVEQDPNDAQKKRTRESSASTENLSS